jgi:Domain of unknown function (DUF4326)
VGEERAVVSTLPVLPTEPQALIAAAHAWLADLTSDPDGITRAHQGEAALDGMRAAVKRAGESEEMELAYAEASRHAGRRLGQLLVEGRANGTVATKGGSNLDASRLPDLGVSYDLAADAVAFAALDDIEWAEAIADAREALNLSRAGVRRMCSAVAAMSGEEQALRLRLRHGDTVVVSYRDDRHGHLIEWATERGLLVRIDRRTDWGNPFEIPADGDRAEVIAKFAKHYLPYKPGLLARLGELRGKALACWCAPESCHGDVLKALSEK